MLRHKLVILCLMTLLTTGCWDAILIEQRALVAIIGIDYLPEPPHYLVTMAHPLVDPDRKYPALVHTVRATSLAEAAAILNHTSNRLLSFGRLLVMVVGKEAARQGIAGAINDLYKHPDVRVNAEIIVTPGKAVDLLSTVPADGQRIGMYVKELLRWGENFGDLTTVRVTQFATIMMTHGMDAHCAIVGPVGTTDPRPDKQKAPEDSGGLQGNEDGRGGQQQQALQGPNESLQIMGTALWYGDRMVGELSLTDGQYLVMLQGQARKMIMQFLFDNEQQIAPETNRLMAFVEKASPQWEVKMSNGKPDVKLNLKVRLRLFNYHGLLDLNEGDNYTLLTEVLGATIRDNTLSVLQKIAATGSDPLYLGQQARLKFPDEWDPVKWPQMLQQATFAVDCKVTVRHAGYQITRLHPKGGGPE